MNTAWMNLKCTLLNERSLFEKVICYNIAFTWHLRKGKDIKIENTSGVARPWGGLNSEAQGILFWEGEIIHSMIYSGLYMTANICQTYRTVQAKNET